MTSGFDRYFQIAPCFRDEDARADRSPGEFYQLDMEMCFADQEDVFSVIEKVLPDVFAKYGIYKSASSVPFKRITYKDALETYGSDKPDLRIDLKLKDITNIASKTEFADFKDAYVTAVNVSNFKESRKIYFKWKFIINTLSNNFNFIWYNFYISSRYFRIFTSSFSYSSIYFNC